MALQIAGLELRKVKAGLYRITGTAWAIGRTAEHHEGPRGGAHARWELRRWDERVGEWVIEPRESFGRLQEAWLWVLAHPTVVLAPEQKSEAQA